MNMVQSCEANITNYRFRSAMPYGDLSATANYYFRSAMPYSLAFSATVFIRSKIPWSDSSIGKTRGDEYCPLEDYPAKKHTHTQPELKNFGCVSMCVLWTVGLAGGGITLMLCVWPTNSSYPKFAFQNGFFIDFWWSMRIAWFRLGLYRRSLMITWGWAKPIAGADIHNWWKEGGNYPFLATLQLVYLAV